MCCDQARRGNLKRQPRIESEVLCGWLANAVAQRGEGDLAGSESV